MHYKSQAASSTWLAYTDQHGLVPVISIVEVWDDPLCLLVLALEDTSSRQKSHSRFYIAYTGGAASLQGELGWIRLLESVGVIQSPFQTSTNHLSWLANVTNMPLGTSAPPSGQSAWMCNGEFTALLPNDSVEMVRMVSCAGLCRSGEGRERAGGCIPGKGPSTVA